MRPEAVRDGTTTPWSVLVVHNRYRQTGGEDVVVAAETALLKAHGHRVESFIVDNANLADPDGLLGRIRLARETVWSDAAATRVADAARDVAADIVHIHNFLPQLSAAVHGAARATGAAVVQTLHNYRLICPAATLLRDGRICEDCRPLPVAIPAVVHGCYRGSRSASAAIAAMLAVHRLRRTWVRDVDAFIALSPFAARILAGGGLPRARIHVKSNFVDIDRSPIDGPRSGFLFVGRLAPEKGIATLLEAWRLAALPTTLRVVGDGPLRAKVEAAASADPTIDAVGFLEPEAVADEMARASALIVPSTWYEAPLTVIEAFASALPVVASGVGPMVDMVADGRTGRLFPPGDARALATALREAAGDRDGLADLGRAARAEYLGRYDAAANYPRIADIYRSALARRSSPGPVV